MNFWTEKQMKKGDVFREKNGMGMNNKKKNDGQQQRKQKTNYVQ